MKESDEGEQNRHGGQSNLGGNEETFSVLTISRQPCQRTEEECRAEETSARNAYSYAAVRDLENSPNYTQALHPCAHLARRVTSHEAAEVFVSEGTEEAMHYLASLVSHDNDSLRGSGRVFGQRW